MEAHQGLSSSSVACSLPVVERFGPGFWYSLWLHDMLFCSKDTAGEHENKTKHNPESQWSVSLVSQDMLFSLGNMKTLSLPRLHWPHSKNKGIATQRANYLLKLVVKIRKRNLCRIPDFLPRFCDFFFLNYGPIESYTDRLFHPGSPPSPRWTHFLCSSHPGLLVALQMRQTLWPAVHCSFLRMLCPTSPT